MHKRVLAACVLAALTRIPFAFAAEAPPPSPESRDWSWNGVFGHYEDDDLQRGFQVYKEVCAGCHSIRLISFRNLSDPGWGIGFTNDQVKEIASEYEVTDGPDDEGEMFDRTAVPSDPFPNPYPNDNAAAASNGGAIPPDLSLINKARLSGPDYVYALLTGYEDPPAELADAGPEGKYYNTYFPGNWIAMAPPLYDEAVEYVDGTPATMAQHAHDVVSFLNWTAEPELEERKAMGLKVMLFLIVLTAMLYAVKRKIWSDIEH